LILFCCGNAAYPCSCAGNNSVCSAYWDTELLFRGRVTEIKFVPDQPPQQVMVNGKVETIISPGTLEVHFTVLERLRGNVSAEVVIRTASQGSACGVEFKDGAEYLIYGYLITSTQQHKGEWWTNKCTRTHEIISAEQDPDLQWIHGLSSVKLGGTIFGTARQTLPDFDNNGYKYQPLAEVPVHFKGPEDRSVTTDDDGEFSLSGLPSGQYEVTPAYPNGLGPATSSIVSVRDKGCAEVHFVAQNDGVVDGDLFYADMTPAAGVYIRLKRIEEGHAPPWTQDLYVDTTDLAGHFHLEPVQPGAYVLGVNIDFPAHGPYRHKNFYPGKTEQEQAEVIHIVGAQRIDSLRYVLPPEPERKNILVKVRVVAPDGAAASNASIFLWNPQWPDFHWGPQVKADADGWYVIELPEGELYNLFARAGGSNGTFPCAGPKAVTASAGIQPIVLMLDGSEGTCFDRHITEIPRQ
ncbi:MAG: hypothetical protein WBU20_09625, partial [Candidatus Acidiferrum sp.]